MRLLRFGILGGLGVMIAILGWAKLGPSSLPLIGNVPSFSLVGADSRSITLEDLKGKVWVASFIFTKCSGICPIMMGQMHQLQSEFTDHELRFVSITVDPEYDTPKVLAGFGSQHGVDSNRWLFLTGNKEAVFKIARNGFRLTTEDSQENQDEQILHSPHFVLIDREAQIRGYYDGTNLEAMEKLRTDLKKLL